MLHQLHDNLWVAHIPHRFLGLHFGTRMTVIRLSSGELLIYSPVTLTDALKSAIDDLGPVGHILAPNRFHHLFVGPYAEAWPKAVLYGAPGLADKRKDLNFHRELDSNTTRAWGDEVDAVLLQGAPSLSEVVLFHRPSCTMIVCDLILNIVDSPSWWTRTYLKMFASYGKPGLSKIIKLTIRDKKAARISIDRMLDWDFDRLIMAHGEPLEKGGHHTFAECYQWL